MAYRVLTEMGLPDDIVWLICEKIMDEKYQSLKQFYDNCVLQQLRMSFIICVCCDLRFQKNIYLDEFMHNILQRIKRIRYYDFLPPPNRIAQPYVCISCVNSWSLFKPPFDV